MMIFLRGPNYPKKIRRDPNVLYFLNNACGRQEDNWIATYVKSQFKNRKKKIS